MLQRYEEQDGTRRFAEKYRNCKKSVIRGLIPSAEHPPGRLVPATNQSSLPAKSSKSACLVVFISHRPILDLGGMLLA